MSDFGELIGSDGLELRLTKKDLDLSFEQKDKIESDLKTLSKLRNYAQEKGYQFGLTGGYAVDVLCSNRITRFHEDMDGIFFVPGDVPYGQIVDDLSEKLLVEVTPWKLEKNNGGDLEFREDDEKKDWAMRRRLELDIFEPNIDSRLVTNTLTDPDGNLYQFETLSVEGLLAAKVMSTARLTAMTEGQREVEGFREMKDSDRQDFLRLMKHPKFNEEATKSELERLICYVSDEEVSVDESKVQSNLKWEAAVGIMK